MSGKFFFLAILFAIACCKVKQPRGKKSMQEYNFLENEFKYLPKMINQKDYLFICRSGSINFSSNSTILCIPKVELNNKFINCYYFSLNIKSTGNTEENESNPEIFGHNFVLKNHFINQEICLQNLKKYANNEVEKYIQKKLIEGSLKEDNCSNIYYITENQNFIYVLDSKSSNIERAFFKSLYRQISPSEYYQSFSLDDTCVKQTDLYYRLVQNKDLDTFNFKINYHIKGGYW